MTQTVNQTALGDVAACQLAMAARMAPQMVTATPQGLTQLLNWIPAESGLYRLSDVMNASAMRWIVPEYKQLLFLAGDAIVSLADIDSNKYRTFNLFQKYARF